MADEPEVNSPAWWLHRLVGRLLMDTPRMVLMDRYYRGAHPLPYVPRVLKTEFRRMLARSRSNFMRMVIEAPSQRLKVQGFRAPGSEAADAEAWDRWKAAGMIAGSNMTITDSMVMGRSYLSVWKFQGDDRARIQVEDPRGVIVDFDRRDRSKRIAGLRMWLDDWTGHVRADVWLPDGCYQFTAHRSSVIRSRQWPQSWQPAAPIDDVGVVRSDMEMREEPIAFDQWHRQWTELGVVPNQTGQIPLIPVVNRPSVLKWPDGESELEDVYLTQDRINEMLFNRALAAWTTAYRQKWATGLDIPVDEHGNPVQPYEAAIDRLWVAPNETARFGEFAATDLKPYIDSIEQDVQHIAVQTQTPRHYFQQQGQDPSGDALKSAETPLVAKVLDKQPTVGDAFCEAQRLAALMDGIEKPEPLEVVWSDPETRTMAELTDAVIKQYGAQLIPRKVALERLGYSPSEIARMDAAFAQEQLVAEAQALATQAAPAAPEPALEG